MYMYAHLVIASVGSDETLEQSRSVLQQIGNTVFGGRSLLVLLVSLVAATILSKISTTLLRNLGRGFAKQADLAARPASVMHFRRLETWTTLSIALVRVVIFIFALYFWWVFEHPGNQPGALIGASALFALVLGGVFGPLLRDFAFGAGMMAEHWYGVGDLITIEPFNGVRGVVERITLRSTRIRGLNGEIMWITNQNVIGVRVAQKGALPMAIELFVNDRKKGEHLLSRVNALLPSGPSLVISPLSVMAVNRRGEDIWHITAIAETAPGREWLIEKTAIDLMKSLDEKSKTPVLVSDPFGRFADNETERQFARAVKNARKTRHKTTAPKPAEPPQPQQSTHIS